MSVPDTKYNTLYVFKVYDVRAKGIKCGGLKIVKNNVTKVLKLKGVAPMKSGDAAFIDTKYVLLINNAMPDLDRVYRVNVKKNGIPTFTSKYTKKELMYKNIIEEDSGDMWKIDKDDAQQIKYCRFRYICNTKKPPPDVKIIESSSSVYSDYEEEKNISIKSTKSTKSTKSEEKEEESMEKLSDIRNNLSLNIRKFRDASHHIDDMLKASKTKESELNAVIEQQKAEIERLNGVVLEHEDAYHELMRCIGSITTSSESYEFVKCGIGADGIVDFTPVMDGDKSLFFDVASKRFNFSVMQNINCTFNKPTDWEMECSVSRSGVIQKFTMGFQATMRPGDWYSVRLTKFGDGSKLFSHVLEIC